MRKSFYVAIIAATLLLPCPLCAAEVEVKADAALIYDIDRHEVLWEKNGDRAMAPASLIKVLNLLTAAPYLSFEEEVTIGPLTRTVYNGQLLDLNVGDVVRGEDLVYAMMLFSANDAAVAVADALVGDIPFYAALMDVKAWALGAVDTVSVNVNGYSDPDQRTTAYDLAVLGSAFMDSERLAAVAGARSHHMTWLSPEKERDIANINQFLTGYAGATGLKTGTTSMAGKCLLATAERDGKRLLAVALNSSDRYGDCMTLMNHGFGTDGVLSVDIIDDVFADDEAME